MNDDGRGLEREHRLFRALAGGESTLSSAELLGALKRSGLESKDPRLAGLTGALEAASSPGLSFDTFRRLARPTLSLVERAARGELVVPDFESLRDQMETEVEAVRSDQRGEVATYIPQLARVPPDRWGASLCTVDGQRVDLGDFGDDFCVQSAMKPLNYALALEEMGETRVHGHVGREPSGQGFSEITLNHAGRPHNPMINAGAIMVCSLIRGNRPLADRFDHVLAYWRKACGQEIGFDNSVFLSERETADRNFALGYFMQEHRAFPEGTDLLETLEFYFMCCSIATTTRDMSLLAATFASGGLHPLTGEVLFSPHTVRDVLSMMSSCGMYDFSGEFAFTVGLPAKSGVSGVVMTVVPNVLGMVTWSPRLDAYGNSTRGLELCRRLVETYNFHVYDNLGVTDKVDPRSEPHARRVVDVSALLWAAAAGDVPALRRLAARHGALAAADYDGRTALHLAAAEGHPLAVEFLIERGVPLFPKDRWGGTPLDDARRHGHADIVRRLEDASDEIVDATSSGALT